MNKTLFATGLGLITALTALSSAQAEERWPLWYLGVNGGYTFMKDEDLSGGGTATKLSLRDGYSVGGSIGYLPNSSIPFLNALRFEGEVMYHNNDVDHVSHSGGRPSTTGGSYDATTYMVNALYDLPTGTPWSPYIGGGVGLADFNLSSNAGAGNTSGHSTQFAYQGLVGVGYTPASIPNTQWTLGYRYLGAQDPKFSGPTGDVKSQYSLNSFELGAKFRF